MECIINADDFGWDKSCTDAIMVCFRNDYIDTTTMMPTGASFDYALNCVYDTEWKSKIGLHLNLTEGKPLTEKMRDNSSFCDKNGNFDNRINRYKRFSYDEKKVIYNELKAQFEKYRKSGLSIHHVDSHHHIHTAPYITPIVCQLLDEYNVHALRMHRNIGNINSIKKMVKAGYNYVLKRKGVLYSNYFGSFEDVQENKDILEKNGVLEIMCHPDINSCGDIIDREGASYNAPQGSSIPEKVRMIRMV